jgi:hypothetical protein
VLDQFDERDWETLLLLLRGYDPPNNKGQQGQLDFVPGGSELTVYLTKHRGYDPAIFKTSP